MWCGSTPMTKGRLLLMCAGCRLAQTIGRPTMVVYLPGYICSAGLFYVLSMVYESVFVFVSVWRVWCAAEPEPRDILISLNSFCCVQCLWRETCLMSENGAGGRWRGQVMLIILHNHTHADVIERLCMWTFNFCYDTTSTTTTAEMTDPRV